MAKLPRLGQVKTRLAQTIGSAQACYFYRHMLAHNVSRVRCDERWTTWLALTPDFAPDAKSLFCRARAFSGLEVIGQGNGDLGERMQRIFNALPGGAPVVIIGTDIPQIKQGDIAQAFKVLGRKDVVIGPSRDGGYWLIGQKRQPGVLNLFHNVRWSGPHAYADTLAPLRPEQFGALRHLQDVDDGESYQALHNIARRLIPPSSAA